MEKKRSDMILIAVLIIAAVIMLIGWRIKKQNAAGSSDTILEITVDGSTVFKEKTEDLELPFTYKVETGNGGLNIFRAERLEDGSIGVSCESADCPDKVCVDTGVITLPGEVIVCLPHRVTAGLY